MPKNICDLLRDFAVFYKSSNRSESVLLSENAEIRIFRPDIWKNDHILWFQYRLYGKVSGSMIPGYNDNFQYCGDVYYSLNLETGELERKERLNKLHDVLTIEVDVSSYLKSI